MRIEFSRFIESFCDYCLINLPTSSNHPFENGFPIDMRSSTPVGAVQSHARRRCRLVFTHRSVVYQLSACAYEQI